MIELPQNKQLILFDGICNLCNSSVQFVIRNDKNDTFMFATLQGSAGQHILNANSEKLENIDSILLYTPDKGIRTQSSAALHIAKKLRFPINLLIIFFIVPPFIRNWVYKNIAKRRYKWFGKQEQCMIPTIELQKKFIE